MEPVSLTAVVTPPPYRLETLGTLVLRGSQRALVAADGRQQRRRLALLSVLATAGTRGRSRDQLLLLFWPDSTEKKARHSLDQLLYAIRTSLDDSIFIGVNPIRLNPSVIDADVWQFESNIEAGNHEAAVSAYHGPFLDGFHPNETQEFEDWLDSERRRLGAKYLGALETLAGVAEREGNLTEAVLWRRKLVEAEPLSTRQAILLVRSLANVGDIAAALEFASRYERTAQRDLGVDTVPDLQKLVAEIRSRPPSAALPDAPDQKPITTERTTSRDVVKLENDARSSPSEQRAGFRFPVATTIGAAIVIIVLVAGFIYTRADQVRSFSLHPTIAAMPVADRTPDRAAMGTHNVAAFDLYKRGTDPVLLRNDSAAALGLQYLEKAVELDSDFAAAHAGVSQMYARMAFESKPPLPQSEMRRRAEASARRAIALDDSLAEGHQSLGLVEAFWPADLRDSEKELVRAHELDRRLPHTLEYLALARTLLGKPTEALEDARQAVADDPLSPINKALLAQMLYVNGRCNEALPILDSLSAMTPALLRVPVIRSACLASEGRWTDAADAVEARAKRGDRHAMALFGFSLAMAGKKSEAIDIRSKLRGMASRNPAALFDVAIVSFALGDMDDTLASLDRANDFGPFPYELMGPLFDSLHRDARFRSIVARRGIQIPARAVLAGAPGRE
jgi:DNA-binding SARP family transcriptional activator